MKVTTHKFNRVLAVLVTLTICLLGAPNIAAAAERAPTESVREQRTAVALGPQLDCATAAMRNSTNSTKGASSLRAVVVDEIVSTGCPSGGNNGGNNNSAALVDGLFACGDAPAALTPILVEPDTDWENFEGFEYDGQDYTFDEHPDLAADIGCTDSYCVYVITVFGQFHDDNLDGRNGFAVVNLVVGSTTDCGDVMTVVYGGPNSGIYTSLDAYHDSYDEDDDDDDGGDGGGDCVTMPTGDIICW